MKIKDVEEMHKGEYTEMEVYRNFASNRPGFHTDRIRSVDDYTEDTEVIEYELADEEKYNQTILANAGPTADFNEWYDNKDAKILLVKVAL
jgi:hypothetical protein